MEDDRYGGGFNNHHGGRKFSDYVIVIFLIYVATFMCDMMDIHMKELTKQVGREFGAWLVRSLSK